MNLDLGSLKISMADRWKPSAVRLEQEDQR